MLNLLTGLFVMLWSFLLIIPGIIAALSYSQATFLMLDDPELSALDAIRQSKALMRGHKGEYFTLCLSFFGWLLLSGLTLGILGIWLEPYMTVTQANYYNSLIGWQPAEAVLPDDAPPAPDAWWGQ